MKVNIELDLGDIVGEQGPYDDDGRGEPLTLLDAIVQEAGRRLVKQIDVDAAQELRRRTKDITDAVIRERVEPLVLKALTGEVQSEFGAKAKPLEQHIVEMVQSALKWREGRYSSDDSMLVKLVRQEVEVALTRELQAELADAKGVVRAAVRERASEVLAETIERMAKR